MDGIITDWKRVPGGEPIEVMIDSIIADYNIAATKIVSACFGKIVPGNKSVARKATGEIKNWMKFNKLL